MRVGVYCGGKALGCCWAQVTQWHESCLHSYRVNEKGKAGMFFLHLTNFQEPGITVWLLDPNFIIPLLTFSSHISRAYIFIFYWVIQCDEFCPGFLLWLWCTFPFKFMFRYVYHSLVLRWNKKERPQIPRRQVPKSLPNTVHISPHVLVAVPFCSFFLDDVMILSQYLLFLFLCLYSVYFFVSSSYLPFSFSCLPFLTLHSGALKSGFHYLLFCICLVFCSLWISQIRLLFSCIAFSWFLNWRDSRLYHHRETGFFSVFFFFVLCIPRAWH